MHKRKKKKNLSISERLTPEWTSVNSLKAKDWVCSSLTHVTCMAPKSMVS